MTASGGPTPGERGTPAVRRDLLTAFACLLIGSVALACGVKPSAGEPPPSTEVAARSPALFATPKPLQKATVVGSANGDTLVLSINGKQMTARLLLIETPEASVGACFSGAATAFVAAVLPPGSSVALERDQSDLDGLGRPLRYAYLPDGSMLNEQLVRGGFARVKPSPPDQKYLERLLEAEEQAKRDGLGLWSACATPSPAPALVQPPATPMPTATALAAVVAPTQVVPATPSPSPTPPPPTATPTPVPTATPTATPTAEPTIPPTPTPAPTPAPTAVAPPPAQPANCDPSYPTVCIPPAPPDLDCGEIPHRRFEVLPPDPHRFDADKDGIGCES